MRQRFWSPVAYGAVLAFALHAAFLGRQVRDDAYVSFRYAARLVAGQGLTFNGDVPVEGYTNFLWVCASAVFEALGASSASWMPFVGFACGAGLVVVVGLEARRLAGLASGSMGPGDDSPVAILVGVLSMLVMVTNPSLAYYSVTGLETGAFALTLTLAGLAAVRARPGMFAVAATLACLLRPEAALFVVLGAPWILLETARLRRSWAPVWGGAGLLAVVVGGYLAWKHFYFGQLAPNTLAAKRPVLQDGIDYLVSAAPALAPLVALSLAGLFVGRRESQRRVLALLLLWVAFAVATMLTGGDWMPGERRLVPAFGLLVVASAPALSHSIAAWSIRPTQRLTRSLVVLLPLHLALLLPTWDWVRGSARNIEAYTPLRRSLYLGLRRLEVKTVATTDVGLLGYLLPEVEVVDLAGLTDKHIAELPGPHLQKDIPPRYLAERDPDVFLLTGPMRPQVRHDGVRYSLGPPVERKLASTRWFAESYRFRNAAELGAGYFLHVFVRRWSSSETASPH